MVGLLSSNNNSTRYAANLQTTQTPDSVIAREPGDTGVIATALAAFERDPHLNEYRALLETSNIVTALAQGDLELEWTTAVLVSDDPIKGEGAVPREDLLTTRLSQAVGTIESRFDGVTPYFVPGEAGVEAFATLAQSGITVRMLTNSLEATNMLPVHAGYTKHREEMLQSGVQLFELRRDATLTNTARTMGPLGSSGSSLHAKTFAVDGLRIFVGSFNFDPRSTTLNTEMGLLIESTQMAEAMHTAFDQGLSGLAWRIEMRNGNPVWIETAARTELSDEPGSTAAKRLALKVIGCLPVEWLL